MRSYVALLVHQPYLDKLFHRLRCICYDLSFPVFPTDLFDVPENRHLIVRRTHGAGRRGREHGGSEDAAANA